MIILVFGAVFSVFGTPQEFGSVAPCKLGRVCSCSSYSLVSFLEGLYVSRLIIV